VQLLTHPVWWTGEAGEGAVSRLDKFVEDRHRMLRRELARNCEPFRDAYGELTDKPKPR
jgi:hypothetical protein